MLRELSKINTAGEVGPVDRLTSFGIQNPGKWIGKDRAGLVHVGHLKERGADEVATTEGRLGAELLEDQLLDRIIKDAISHADAGFAGTAGQFGQ